MHEETLNCINSYLMDCLTKEQARTLIGGITMTPGFYDVTDQTDWRNFVPLNLRLCWRQLTSDTQVGVALMAMGATIGAIGSYKAVSQ